LSRLLTLLKRVVVFAILLAALIYAGDYILIRYRIAMNRSPYGSLRIRRYYAVTMKNGKPEYFFDQPTDQTCIHSLFPHLGYQPCWYLARKTTQEVKM
jgi:hypothetical protein